MNPARPCIICKGGRNLCGNPTCPLISRINIKPSINKAISKDFFGPSMNIFIGRHGYPNINAGPMAAIEERPGINSPGSWFGTEYSKLVEMGSLMIRSKQKENIFSKSRLVAELQELAMAGSPTDIELHFKKEPVYNVSFSDVNQPMGPSGVIEKLRITENPKIPGFVDSIINDEMKAAEAGYMLYRRKQDVYKIATILSSGAMGIYENKKMVPTRYSITATDDMIFKQLIGEIKDFPSVNEYMVFSSNYLDNHFQILLMPGNWEYENFEAWAPGSFWSADLKKMEIVHEYEPWKGRTKYADNEGGGYYAARIGVTEGLKAMKKQARVVVFREIYEGYVIPLGVWVVRETVRNAFKNKPERFAMRRDALNHISSKLRVPIKDYIKQSSVLKRIELSEFFN